MHDLLAFSDSARVWIYQGNDVLEEEAIQRVNQRILEFTEVWTSHNRNLRATGGLLHDRFLVLVVDEENAGASGCSIDASVRFVQSIGADHNVDFFDRWLFAYLDDNQVKTVHRNDLKDQYAEGRVKDDTLFFDNLVSSKGQFLTRWLVPLGESWMKRFV